MTSPVILHDGRVTRREANEDARKSYDFWTAVSREKHVRAHAIDFARVKPHEMRWWNEGPVPDSKLDTVKQG